jgi:hypothetical protein
MQSNLIRAAFGEFKKDKMFLCCCIACIFLHCLDRPTVTQDTGSILHLFVSDRCRTEPA